MAIVRFTLDPAHPPKLTPEQRAKLASLTEAEIDKAARSDPDNPPFTDAELERMRSVRLIKDARAKTGLSQGAFAKRFRINLARLRDLEQGRTTADSALVAYLQVITRAQKTVERALAD